MFQKPFAGDYSLANFFDHNLPFEGDPTYSNGFQQTWWGERTIGYESHNGYDWSMPEGTPLFAVADGQVVFAGENISHYCLALNTTVTGLLVSLDHSLLTGGQPAVRSLYDHLSRVDVQVGQQIKAGDPVGLSGNTGCSTGPHLHYGTYRYVPATGLFVPIDPFGWEGVDADPWEEHPQGAQSLWLWKGDQAPSIFRDVLLPPNPSGSTAPVAVTIFRSAGWKDNDNPNNEFVEITLDARFAPGGVFDLTGFSLRNNKGDIFNFPIGFKIYDGSPVKIFSGSGISTATQLYWGQNQGMWDDLGDCARLVYPQGGAYTLRTAGTCGVVTASEVQINMVTNPPSGQVGQKLTYTASVTSNGPNNATGIVVNNDVPLGATLDSYSTSQGLCFGTSAVICNIGTLAPGTSATVLISMIPKQAGTIMSTVTVEANEADSNLANNTATVMTTVSPVFTLTVAKAGSGSGAVISSLPGVNCGADCSEPYLSGQNIGLTGTAAVGSVFAGFTGDADCLDGVVTMDANKNCTATFNLIPPVGPLTIGASSLAGGEANLAYNGNLQIGGGSPPYTISFTKGSLPAGLQVNGNGILSGTLSAAAKSSTFTLKVSDGVGAFLTKQLKIIVAKALSFTTSSLKAGTVGKSYSATFKAKGGQTPLSWSLISGSLPAGLTLNATAGSITGIPTQSGSSNRTFKVTDSLGASQQKTFTLVTN